MKVLIKREDGTIAVIALLVIFLLTNILIVFFSINKGMNKRLFYRQLNFEAENLANSAISLLKYYSIYKPQLLAIKNEIETVFDNGIARLIINPISKDETVVNAIGEVYCPGISSKFTCSFQIKVLKAINKFVIVDFKYDKKVSPEIISNIFKEEPKKMNQFIKIKKQAPVHKIKTSKTKPSFIFPIRFLTIFIIFLLIISLITVIAGKKFMPYV